MRAQPLLTGALLITVSVVLSVWIATTAIEAERGAPSVEAVESGRLDALETRVAELERLRESAPANEVRVTRSPTPRPGTDRLSALEDRLASLETKATNAHRIDASARSTMSAFEALKREQRMRDLAREKARKNELETIDAAKRVLANSGASAEDKILAHGSLRRVADAYTPAMIQALIRIGQTHPHPQKRASVWTYFDGATTSPLLVEPLLHAMRFDKSDIVRAEAAETLGNYKDNVAVMQALERAARHDRSNRVREKAMRSVPRR